MRTREDIEAYLGRSGYPHREVAEDTWLVSDTSEGREQIVVRLGEGLVVFRLKVLELARAEASGREALYSELLRLNAEDMVHGAYGISQGDVMILATLRLENLDYSEFAGTLEDFFVAVTNHHPKLRKLARLVS
jgi:hypothetical protein